MTVRKASRLYGYYLLVRSLFTTLWYSIQVTVFCNHPQKVDKALEAWGKKMVRWVQLTYHIENPNNVHLESKKPYIIMSSHNSLYDIPLGFITFPHGLRMIGKREIFDTPIWGKAILKAGFISIDRSNTKAAIASLHQAKGNMTKGLRYWIAPEGGRSRTGELMPLKKGGFMLAQQTQATIIPVAIQGAFEVLPPGHLSPIQIGHHATIRIGKPLDMSEYRKDNIEEAMAIVAQELQKMLSP